MSFIVTFIAAVFVFSAVIAIHEFGHFMVAKLCGVQVNEFSIGMGPVLCKRVRKGTQYSIRALPVGGFVALEGEESPESKQAEERSNPSAADGGSSPDRGALGIAETSPEEEKPAGIPLNEAPVWQRALIMLAGAGMNFVLGFVVMAILITAQSEPITSKVLYQVEENALCGQTGLQAGDKILAVNGRRCFVANDILYELMRTEDYTADFTVLRDGKKVELPGVQFDTWQDDKGETHMSLGFTVYGIKKTTAERAERGGQQRALLRAHHLCLPLRPAAGAGEHQRPLRPGGHRNGHRAGRQLRLAGPAGDAGAHHRECGHLQPAALPGAGRRQSGVPAH
ncbi:peptidase, M50 family [Faecalibacterium duncaniae]|uniref:Peptidase, M50 family n=1 Tax=Faecalibacterium duncaniae (strain DSM 17677 / JCM 31915 / A2-165) TaxID=411483 RepID=C7H783_FAED2|nr:peptidase, M50 family [Faecalibacterium duncaniae]